MPEPITYCVLGSDGQFYGPVPAHLVHQWIHEGRCHAGTWVRVSPSGTWMPLHQVPELAAALMAAPPVSAPPRTRQPAGTLPLAPDVTVRDPPVRLLACLSRASRLLTGPHMGLWIGSTALLWAIYMGLTLLQFIPLVGLLSSLLFWVSAGPLTAGYYYLVLLCLRGYPAQVSDLFIGFRYRFLDLFLAFLLMGIVPLLSAVPGLLLVAAGLFSLLHHGRFEVLSLPAVLLGAGGILAFVPVLYLVVCWFFTCILILDKGLDFWLALRLGLKVVRRCWWRVFLLFLFVCLLNVAVLMACCVGWWFSFPLTMATAAGVDEQIFTLPTVQHPTSAQPAPNHP